MDKFYVMVCGCIEDAACFESDDLVDPDTVHVLPQFYGEKLYDFVGISPGAGFLLSKRVVEALHVHSITGFYAIPVKLVDIKKNESTDYSYIAVTGTCGKIDSTRSRAVIKKGYRALMGLYFDESTWDGTDMFIAQNTRQVFVTRKVKEVFDQLKVTNVDLAEQSKTPNYVIE